MLPNALMIGVDYDLFWTLNPKSLAPFIKAFQLRNEYYDTMSWQLGAYIRMAVASVLSKTARYPVETFTKKSKEQNNMELFKERFIRDASRINSRIRKGEN